MAAFLGLLAFILAALLVAVATLYFQAKRELNTAQQGNARIQQQAKMDFPTDGGHPVKGVYSPEEVQHGKKTTHLHS